MKMQDILLSEYGAASVIPSPVNRMMESFSVDFRENVDINLGVGYVNEATIPRDWILEAQKEIFSNPQKYRAPFNYSASIGSKNLIKSLRRFLINNKIGVLNENILSDKRILIGVNGATSLLESVAQIIPPGLVITANPLYYIFTDYLERKGFKILAISENKNGIGYNQLDEKISQSGFDLRELRFFYFVTINNPTSTILANSTAEDLVKTATRISYQLGRKIPLFFDRAYEGLVHDPHVEPPRSGFFHDEAEIVYEVGTLSKILAPGLRIGYMIGRDGPFLSSMIQRTSDMGFSASLINQEIASYVLDHYGTQQLELVNTAYRKKAVFVNELINKYLREYLGEIRGGQGGFYYYLTFREIETHPDSLFFKYLARTTGSKTIDGPESHRKSRVAYLPGSFCVGKDSDQVALGNRQLRLSYGFENEKRLQKAIILMKEAADFSLARCSK